MGITIKAGDRLRITDPQIQHEDKVLIGTVEAINSRGDFIFQVDGSPGFRTMFNAERKGTITVERLEDGAS